MAADIGARSVLGSGSGDHLNPTTLLLAGISTAFGTAVSISSITLQLKNYRKPVLQRMVIRIMLMVPIYAIASLIALFSLEAAFFIDAVRDIYEAFVIYCFFNLLVAYLGGERSLLVLLYGRPPKHHVFPINLFKTELDGSDPFTFLMLRRGIFQYVYVKPVLAAVTMILKANDVYNEGSLKVSSGYFWVSLIYNLSICTSLYCLAMFWVCINDDVKPFRPIPKFLCVKGVLFFSFWQSLAIAIIVNAGLITHIGPYTSPETISLAITDSLVCFEMPFFAIAHMFAFSHTDYVDPTTHYAARMPFYYAFRDAFGILDVLEDSRATLKGGVSYREFEPVEGGMHQGSGRDRRIKAGLRYAAGGKQKYWLPMPEESGPVTGPIAAARNFLEDRRIQKDGYAPLVEDQEESVFTDEVEAAPQGRRRDIDRADVPANADTLAFTPPPIEGDPDSELNTLEFQGPDQEEEATYAESQKLLFGDYNYPCIDVSSEEAKKTMWDEEERILSDRRAAAFSPMRVPGGVFAKSAGILKGKMNGGGLGGYGAAGETSRNCAGESSGAKRSVYAIGGRDIDAPRNHNRNGSPVPFDETKAVIDMAPEAPKPEINVDGVKLQLSKRGRLAPSMSSSPSRTPTKAKSPPTRMSPTYLSPGAEGRESQSLSKKSSTSSDRSSQSDGGRPPDAIDLVVEDPKAAEEEMARERRKGEPAVRQSGQRKVYKSAFAVEGDDGDKEVAVEHEIEPGAPEPRKQDPQQPIIDRTQVTIRDPSTQDASASGWGSPVAEVTLARAVTPPPHALLEVKQYRSPEPASASATSPFDLDPEDNPWK